MNPRIVPKTKEFADHLDEVERQRDAAGQYNREKTEALERAQRTHGLPTTARDRSVYGPDSPFSWFRDTALDQLEWQRQQDATMRGLPIRGQLQARAPSRLRSTERDRDAASAPNHERDAAHEQPAPADDVEPRTRHASGGDLVRDDELVRNVAAGVASRGRKTTKPRPPSDAELARLLAAVRPSERAVVEFAAASGLRRGEVFALRWRDVDLEAREIHVRRSKTEAGERSVPLFGSLRKLLLEQKARSRHKRPDDFVFATAVGSQEDAALWYKREFRAPLDRAGLSFRFHDLRHYAVSKLIDQGANILLVSRVAGHSRPSITLDVYGHLMVEGLAEAATRYDPLRQVPRLRAVDER